MTGAARARIALAFGAHPDDVEISCAGTLRALKEIGYTIHIATMTLGDCGSKDLSPDEVRRVRRVEAEEACRVLGATYHYAGSQDFCIFSDDAHNRRATALVREVAPTVVFTHSPGDYILDHDNTSTAVRNACFNAPAPNYDCTQYSSAPAIPAIPHLYYWDVMEGINIFGKAVEPEFYVDISGDMEVKSKMLAAHRSQREWLRAQHGLDEYLESMREWNARRGREAADILAEEQRSRTESPTQAAEVTYAEAFRQHLGHAYPRENVLLELLPRRVVRNPRY